MASGQARVDIEDVPALVEDVLSMHVGDEDVEVKVVPQGGDEYEIKWNGVK